MVAGGDCYAGGGGGMSGGGLAKAITGRRKIKFGNATSIRSNERVAIGSDGGIAQSCTRSDVQHCALDKPFPTRAYAGLELPTDIADTPHTFEPTTVEPWQTIHAIIFFYTL